MTARASSGGGRPDVAFFVPSLRGGGAERVMLDLATAAAERGLHVHLVAASATGPNLEAVPPDVTLVDLGRPRIVASFAPLVRYLRRVRPRSLLSTLDHANAVAVLAARLAGVRVAVRQANAVMRPSKDASLRLRVLLPLVRWTYPRADAVIAVSEGLGDRVREAYGVPPERLHVIPNPAITPRLHSGATGTPDHPWFRLHDLPIVLGVGRMNALKRFDVLIRAFARARERTPCRLVILGDGELRETLEALAEECGVEEHVSMPGFVPEPFPYMAAADLFVLSSESEGMPNVLIQAMAMGTRVAATDCPTGPREVLDDGRYGPLVPVNDEEALADAIVESLSHPPRPVPDAWLDRFRLGPIADRYLEVLGVGAGQGGD